jgi:NADH-ubiquinone oxidoreductase chain 2
LLAYSTISHIGYILLALGIYTEQSIDSFIFYIIQYIITNLNIFLIIIALGYIINQSINEGTSSANPYPLQGGVADQQSSSMARSGELPLLQRSNNDKPYFKDIRYISEFKGQFYSNPLISLSFSICLFSIAGIPPLIGFFSKQFVLYSAIQSGYNFIALVAIFVSVISASYYLKIIKTFFIDFDSPSAIDLAVKHKSEGTVDSSLSMSATVNDISGTGQERLKLNNSHSFLISTLTLSILFFIFKPSLILNITQLLSLSLFYI